jgi:glycosyltransferase involved in cell wall biosynthesis
MQPISVVIICKNEAAVIGATLQSLQGLTDDVIVYDNGSTDNTTEIARQFNVNVHQGSWEGFGKTKAKANKLAKHDWILSLDADERIDEELKRSLLAIEPDSESTVYDLRFKNYLGNKLLKHGEWGYDWHIRLFNRKAVHWNTEAVHETLVLPGNASVKKLKGAVLHQTMKDIQEYAQKMVHYAMLSADKYYQQGKKASLFKIRLSPGFNFLNYYIIKLGFLDGHEGYICAKMTAHYTFLKYARLRELWNKEYTTGNIE